MLGKSSTLEIVESMWTAFQEGRLHDALALMHPAVAWSPASRPARTVYTGHAGIRAMYDELRQIIGPHHIDTEPAVELPDGRVVLTGRVVRETPDGDVQSPAFEVFFELRDGLVIRVDSQEAPSD